MFSKQAANQTNFCSEISDLLSLVRVLSPPRLPSRYKYSQVPTRPRDILRAHLQTTFQYDVTAATVRVQEKSLLVFYIFQKNLKVAKIFFIHQKFYVI